MTEQKTKPEIFIAHDHRDAELANEVKWQLEDLGATTFLAATNDIEPSEEWRREIFAHLTTCAALVAIITDNFSGSAYANQEAGIILGKEKPVIPIRFGETRIPGFIEARQAIPATKETIAQATKRAFNYVKAKDSAFIRTGFVIHSSVRDIAIKEVREHVLWRGKDTKNVSILDEDIRISTLSLKEALKAYEVNGTARSTEKMGFYVYGDDWAWAIVVDAISGRIISEQFHTTSRTRVA